MRVLVVSNLYPPHYNGGYELRCQDVAEALQGAGHEVRVLTSAYGLPTTPFGDIRPRAEQVSGIPVYRYLNQYALRPQPAWRPARVFRPKRELWDARRFLHVLSDFQPDVVTWWSMYGLSKMLLALARRYDVRDVYWIEHWWMISEYGRLGERAARFWRDTWDGNWGPAVGRPLFRRVGRAWERRFEAAGVPTRDCPSEPRHVSFVSEYMRGLHRDAGLEFRSSEVIHGGVRSEQFYAPVRRQPDRRRPLRLLYAGQVSRDRGLDTVVEAIGQLPPRLRPQVTLTVAGNGSPEYVDEINARAGALGLGRGVSYLGKIPRERMPAIYQEHDVLVFSSRRPEGLPLTMIEAMLAGCAVLTTGSGGAMEIAVPAELPIFPKSDSRALAKLVGGLVSHRERVPEIAVRGQNVALREFAFDRMMDRWTATLMRLKDGE